MVFETSLARRMALVIAAGFALSATAGTLTGPVTEGERGGPYGAVDVADRGYQTEEYFLAGSATAYELAEGEHTPDGRWNTRPAAGKADFKTRMLVVRPEDPDAFNGTVIVLWLNVSAGFEVGLAVGEALRGYAWVGVSAQKVGIDGFPQDPQGLKAWDGSATVPSFIRGGPYSYTSHPGRPRRGGRPACSGRPRGRADDRRGPLAVRRTPANVHQRRTPTHGRVRRLHSVHRFRPRGAVHGG